MQIYITTTLCIKVEDPSEKISQHELLVYKSNLVLKCQGSIHVKKFRISPYNIRHYGILINLSKAISKIYEWHQNVFDQAKSVLWLQEKKLSEDVHV